MKEKSYAESMKKNTLNRKQLKDTYVLHLYIEMLLSEVQLISEKEKLAQKIDQALDDRNKALFTQLSKEYKELNERFGN
ncbi:IDEAL domain-containing protein [Bacillus infantis]|uniref:IDEAL domain-containing protein n=1 Tax=Bacillus infantis TaxID=324767 RepID=UPI001CD32604|nr:IDEAL domain-containing protein [Bacillus infantis]MCA1039428.1 IDEAL domain-containing protein [Bacillus infantis]